MVSRRVINTCVQCCPLSSKRRVEKCYIGYLFHCCCSIFFYCVLSNNGNHTGELRCLRLTNRLRLLRLTNLVIETYRRSHFIKLFQKVFLKSMESYLCSLFSVLFFDFLLQIWCFRYSNQIQSVIFMQSAVI